MSKGEKVLSAGALDDLSKPSEVVIGQCNQGSPQVTLTDSTPEHQTKDIEVMFFFNRKCTRIFWSRPFLAARLAASAAINN